MQSKADAGYAKTIKRLQSRFLHRLAETVHLKRTSCSFSKEENYFI